MIVTKGINMRQQAALRAPFPPSVLNTIRGMTYVPVGEVVARLNNVLDDFSITTSTFDMPVPGEIIAVVTISATIDGHHRTAVGVGGDQVTTRRDSDDIVDLGNNFKTAASEALKKAAWHWGVGLGLSRGDERERIDVEHYAAKRGSES